MAKKIQNKSFIEKYLGSLGGAITIIFACLGGGFAVGRYYEKIELDAKIRELENQKQLQITECGEKMFELQKEVFVLQKEIIDLKEINSKSDNYRNEIKK